MMTYKKLARFFRVQIVTVYNDNSEESLLLFNGSTYPISSVAHCFKLLCKDSDFTDIELIKFIICEESACLRALLMESFDSGKAFSVNYYPVAVFNKTAPGFPESYHIQRSDGKIFDESGKLVDQISVHDVLLPFKEGLVSGRDKIAAIKRYREVFGCGLKEAQDAVESWMSSEAAQISVHDVLTPFKEGLASGRDKIAAIKRYREVFGCGLGEAKDAVESWMTSEAAQMYP